MLNKNNLGLFKKPHPSTVAIQNQEYCLALTMAGKKKGFYQPRTDIKLEPSGLVRPKTDKSCSQVHW